VQSAEVATIARELTERGLAGPQLSWQQTRDDIPTLWTDAQHLKALLRYARNETHAPYRMLLDLTAIDERMRTHRDGQPHSDFTLVYHLMPFERNEDLRVKVPLQGECPEIASVTDIFPNAN